MQKEMNEAAGKGYHYSSFMGGETSFGGHEVVVVMVKPLHSTDDSPREYRLIAAHSASALEKNMQRAGEDGFEYKGNTSFRPDAGASREVLVIMERSAASASRKYSYQFLATVRTSTMQKELQQAGQGGFKLLGVALSQTTIGIDQVVAILGKEGQ